MDNEQDFCYHDNLHYRPDTHTIECRDCTTFWVQSSLDEVVAKQQHLIDHLHREIESLKGVIAER